MQFPQLFMLLCRHKVVRFTLASFVGEKNKKVSVSLVFGKSLIFNVNVTVKLPGNSSMADIPQIQQFLSGEQLPLYFTVRQIGSAKLLSFQTCASIHNMHVLDFQKNTKREKDQAGSKMSRNTLGPL